MLEVLQACNRDHMAELPADAAALERKLATAHYRLVDRGSWLKLHDRMACYPVGDLVLQRDPFAMRIAREGRQTVQ